jgi:polysaccharide deacetylase family protein (PEP-CTERM system associated)
MPRRLTGATISPTRTVVATTHGVLDMLGEAGVRATFFVVGNVAGTYPELVREVARRRDEIGSHTHSHELIFRMDPSAFKADVERSTATLQDLTGQPVLWFRAPKFPVGHLRHWCFEILSKLGLRHDSSVFPLLRVRHGFPEAPRSPFEIATPNGPIQEYPLATWNIGRFRLPFSGGSYFRLLPDRLVHRALDAIDESGLTAVLYFHAYEFHGGCLIPPGPAWWRGPPGR